MAVTRLFDTSDAVELFAPQCLYLKPIARLTISVMLPESKHSPKLISNWELMETLKKMAYPDQITSLRVSRSTMEFIRFEVEVENKNLVQTVWEKFNNKTIKVNGINEMARVLAVASQVNFPSPSDWKSFFKTAESINEALPGERPDTIHVEGLPCKWLSSKQLNKEKPVEEILQRVFGRFGEIRNIDIPTLDPYREEMTGKKFNTFSTGGLPTFEAYIQYQECAGFERAMSSLRGMKLVHKGDDGKALACNIKVTFDTTKHLSDAAIEKRHLERLKLQELERQREKQKQRDKEEEQSKETERKRREEERERERRRKEKLRRREHRQKECEERRRLRKLWKIKMECEKEKREASAWEERKLVLAQRKLDSFRLLTILLNGAKEMKVQRSQLPERDMVKCYQKRVGGERPGDSQPKKPDEDATEKGSHRVKSETWRQIKAPNENIDGKVDNTVTGAMEPLSSQDTNCPSTTSLPPIGLMEEHRLPSLNLAGVKVSTSHESESLQITVMQDCGAHPGNLHAGGHDNCSCNGYSRKVTTVDHQTHHRLYEYEDFLTCLLNYHQYVCPLDSNHPNIFHGANAPGHHSGWHRTVSDNGKSFRIDLRNKSSPLCTETSTRRWKRWPGYDCDGDYRWTITVSGSGVQHRPFSSSTSRELKEYNREFKVQWKDSGCQMDFEEDLASGYRLHCKNTEGSAVLGCNLRNQKGKLIENPRIEVKDSWIPSKEPWRNPITNWKVSIKNSQKDPVWPRMKESGQCGDASNHESSQLNSQCRAEPDCSNKESLSERSRSNRKMKRMHEDNVCEFGADIDWSNCKSGFHQDASNQKSNKKSETYNNDVRPVLVRSGSDLKYSWKETESKFKEEPDNSNKPCSGHQRKDFWNGKGSAEIPNKELVLANQLCDQSEAFSNEVKHKKQRKNSKTKVIPEAQNNKHLHNPIDSNRNLKTHWKHMKNEYLDNNYNSERSLVIRPAFHSGYWPRERDFELDLGANGTQTYFQKRFASDHRLINVNICEQKMKKYKVDVSKLHHSK